MFNLMLNFHFNDNFWGGCGMKPSLPLVSVFYRGARKSLRQDSALPDRESKPGHPAFEARMLTTQPRCLCSVTMIISDILDPTCLLPDHKDDGYVYRMRNIFVNGCPSQLGKQQNTVFPVTTLNVTGRILFWSLTA
jgi:hypothetical protein